MRLWLVHLIVFVIGAHAAHAQVEFFIREANRADTVIAFGVTRPGDPIVDSFQVRNTSGSEVKVTATRLDLNGATSAVVIEFDTIFSNEETVKSGTTLTFKVVYRAGGVFPADSLAEIRLVLRAVDVASGSQVNERTFILHGLKTNKALGSLQRRIRFDSVYVNPTPAPSTKYAVQSLLQRRLQIQSQRLRLRTSSMGFSEVVVDTIAAVEFADRGRVEWPVRYLPQDMGADTAEFIVTYVNSDIAADTMLTTMISGFGVRQSLELGQVRVTGGAGDVSVDADTISVSNVLAAAETSTISVPLINTGNIDVHVDSVRIVTVSGPVAFAIRQPLTTVGVGRTETLTIEFAPDRKANFQARIEVYSDLARRSVRGAPPSAAKHVIPIFGSSRSLLDVQPESVDYGVVLIAERCDVVETEEFAITNRGLADARIDSIRFNQPDVDLMFTPSAFLLPAGATRTVEAVFTPKDRGRITGDVLLYTSGPERVRPVSLTADVKNALSVFLELTESVSGRPGSIVEMPVRVASGSPLGAQTGSLSLEYDPTVVELVGVRRELTACQNAVLADVPSIGGRRIVIQDQQGLLDRDTLLILQLRLFLGDSVTSVITFNRDSSHLGTNACDDLLPMSFRPGSVRIDSVCGLSYKTAVGGLKTFRAGILPNPAGDAATVAVMANPGSIVTIDILDALGRPCAEARQLVCREPLSVIPIDVSALTPAAYAVVVHMADAFQMIPLVVRR
jgi:hypothetical protein